MIVSQGVKMEYQFIWTIEFRATMRMLNDPWLSQISLLAWPIFINMDIYLDGWKVQNLITSNRI